MTVRDSSLIFFNAPAALPAQASSEDHLRALAEYSRAQLSNAFLNPTPTTARSASRLLFQCCAFLTRIDRRRVEEGPSEEQKKLELEYEYDRQALVYLVQSHPELYDDFCACREKVKQEMYIPGR